MFESIKKWIPFKRGEKTNPQPISPVSQHPVEQLHRELNQVFGRFSDGKSLFSWPSAPTSGFDGWFGDFSPSEFSPALDIADELKHLKVTADLPGMDADDIELNVRENALVIRGEKHLEEESKDEGYYRTERAYGVFERVVPLPYEVDTNHAEAMFKKGVLTVRLPKIPNSQQERKRIAIRSC